MDNKYVCLFIDLANTYCVRRILRVKYTAVNEAIFLLKLAYIWTLEIYLQIYESALMCKV